MRSLPQGAKLGQSFILRFFLTFLVRFFFLGREYWALITAFLRVLRGVSVLCSVSTELRVRFF